MNLGLKSNSKAIEKQELICVYILKLANEKHYTGMSNHMGRRLMEHLSRQCKSTRNHLPLEVIFAVEIKGRKKARVLECRIKAQGAKRWLNRFRFSKDRNEYDIHVIPKEWENS